MSKQLNLSGQFDQTKSKEMLKLLYLQLKGMIEDNTTVNFSNSSDGINCQFLTESGQININVLDGAIA